MYVPDPPNSYIWKYQGMNCYTEKRRNHPVTLIHWCKHTHFIHPLWINQQVIPKALFMLRSISTWLSWLHCVIVSTSVGFRRITAKNGMFFFVSLFFISFLLLFNVWFSTVVFSATIARFAVNLRDSSIAKCSAGVVSPGSGVYENDY